MLRGGVEEAPIDGKPYVRQDAGWVGFDYPETEPEVYEFTTAGAYNITVPVGKHYCYAFIVNGGNGGNGGNNFTYIEGGGGHGGKTLLSLINVTPLSNIEIFVGNGGQGGGNNGGIGSIGSLSFIKYNNIAYSPDENNPQSSGGVETPSNGILNQYNKSDTNLYGADGGYGSYKSGIGGVTGGGKGGGYQDNGYDGTFYGAGGGGGGFSTSSSYVGHGGDGYRGYVYLKFT